MYVTKPYEFIGFGAMYVTKPYTFIGETPTWHREKQMGEAPGPGEGGTGGKPLTLPDPGPYTPTHIHRDSTLRARGLGVALGGGRVFQQNAHEEPWYRATAIAGRLRHQEKSGKCFLNSAISYIKSCS